MNKLYGAQTSGLRRAPMLRVAGWRCLRLRGKSSREEKVQIGKLGYDTLMGKEILKQVPCIWPPLRLRTLMVPPYF